MGLLRVLRLCILCLFLSPLCSITKCGGSDVSVKFLKAPRAVSHLNTATFAFEVLNCSKCCCCLSCKVDDGIGSTCANREVTYSNLRDGNHRFEVCTIGKQGLGCAYYNWTVDTTPPTAYVTAPTSFTSSLNVSVNITFSEPCIGGGGFGCNSVNACNLLVYGAGQVIPSSLSILQPNLMYSLLVSLSPAVQYGQAILEMDKNFCTDIAGNSFTRKPNSSVYIHFDRRKVYVNLMTPIPEKLLQLDSENRTVQATNDYNKLQVYLYFSVPVLNSSTQIMNSLNISQGSLLPTSAESLGNRRFGFMIANISPTAIISVDFNSESIITRQGTQVSPIAPVTFLYDSRRPDVMLSTYSMRTREDNFQILINFMKPVFGFNASCILIFGGSLKSFDKKKRSTYVVEVQANEDMVFVSVPENVTSDVVGNQNLASKVLQVRHYSVPVISSVVYALTTASFVVTLIAAGLLTIATASLQSVVPTMSSSVADPARNLFRIMGHMQVFALSRWLAVELPVEFFEFARNLQWTIPYFSVPWEAGHMKPFMVGSSPFGSSNSFTKASATITNTLFESLSFTSSVNGSPTLKKNKGNGSPLNSSEYQKYFEEAGYLDSQHSSGWTDFYRSMFWLAVICGGLMVLHAFLLIILRFGKRNSQNRRTYGALTFPRFEIFLLSLALPSICKASAVLIRGGAPSAVTVGILLLVFVFIMLLALFLFLLVGITFERLLQYKEGQWTWKEQTKSVYLTIFGPLFEDLRGPENYMLSQISGGNLPTQRGSTTISGGNLPTQRGSTIISSGNLPTQRGSTTLSGGNLPTQRGSTTISGGNLPTQRGSTTTSGDETKDAKAPFIQKLFGNLRIYYVLLEYIRRISLGILAGIYNQTQPSKSPVIIMLSISSFELFFIVLKKPFKNKKVQLAEIISLTCEVALFATCLVLLKKENLSVKSESKFGISMLVLFLLGYCPQITNEWNALYEQTKLLDPKEKSLLTGSKFASVGFLRYFIPQKYMKNMEEWLLQNGIKNEESLGSDVHRRSTPTDPSTSGSTRRSGPEQKNATKRKRKGEAQAHAMRENKNKGIEDNKEKELDNGDVTWQETSGENEWDNSGRGEAANDNVTGDAMWQATSGENDRDDSGTGETTNENATGDATWQATSEENEGEAANDNATGDATWQATTGENEGEATNDNAIGDATCQATTEENEGEAANDNATWQATTKENEGKAANDNATGDATWQASTEERDDSGTGEVANDNVTGDATWQATSEENQRDDSGTGGAANDNDGDRRSGRRSSSTHAKASFGRGRSSTPTDHSTSGIARRSGPGKKNVTRCKNKGEAQAHTQKRENNNRGIKDEEEEELVTEDATCQATSGENELDDSGMVEAENDNVTGDATQQATGGENEWGDSGTGEAANDNVTGDATCQATSPENERDDSGTGEAENDNVIGDATGPTTGGENEWGDSGMEEAANDNVTGDATWQVTSEENEWDDSGMGKATNDNDGDPRSSSRSSGTPAKASFGRGRSSAPTDHSTSATTRRSRPGQKNVTKRKNKGEAQAHTRKRENTNQGSKDDKEKELVTEDVTCQATSGENEWDDIGTGEAENDNVAGDATGQATSGQNEWGDSGMEEAAAKDNDESTA